MMDPFIGNCCSPLFCSRSFCVFFVVLCCGLLPFFLNTIWYILSWTLGDSKVNKSFRTIKDGTDQPQEIENLGNLIGHGGDDDVADELISLEAEVRELRKLKGGKGVSGSGRAALDKLRVESRGDKRSIQAGLFVGEGSGSFSSGLAKGASHFTPEEILEAAAKRARKDEAAEGSGGQTFFGIQSERVEKKDRSKKAKKDRSKSKKHKKEQRRRRRSSDSDSSDCSSAAVSSSSESVFRVASTGHHRSSQQRLFAFAKKRPGKLTSAMLQEMQNVVGRDGERETQSQSKTPAVAKAYFLQVLSLRNQTAGARNLREMKTLCTVLDHLALGRFAQAADVVSQRLKSLELSIEDGNWNRSVFLELVPQEQGTLISRDDHHLMQKELGLSKTFHPKGGYKNDSWDYGKGKANKGNQAVANWVPNQYNKGKGKKGKFEKGKNKAANKAENQG
jgi:hypothetical protein